MDEKIKITFDKEYKIRIMDPIKFERSEQLDTECNSFMESKFSFFYFILFYVTFFSLHFIS